MYLHYRCLLVIFVYNLLFISQLKCQVRAPEPRLQALWPSKGILVSIPSDGSINNFAFHGKLNEQLGDGELGREWSQNVRIVVDGRLEIADYKTKLKIGDQVYYRVNIGYKDLPGSTSHRVRKGVWTVNGYVYGNGTAVPQEFISPDECRYLSVTKVNGLPLCAGQEILNDDFNANSISEYNWLREHRFSGPPDFEFVVYVKNDTNSYTRNGRLVLKPTLLEDSHGDGAIEDGLDLGEECTGRANTNECNIQPIFGQIVKPIVSARLKSRVSFRYGRVRIRAKLPRGFWIIPQMFLEPKDVQHSGLSSCVDFPGRIRIASAKNSENLLSAGLMRCATEPQRSEDLKTSELNKLYDFHDYSIQWNPENITLTVDGHDYDVVTPRPLADVSEQLAFGKDTNTEMNLIIGIGVGGINDYEDGIRGKPWRNKDPRNALAFWKQRNQWLPTWRGNRALLEIDYVRINAL